MFSVNTHELKKSGSQLFDCSNELKTMAIRLGRVSGSLFMGKKQQHMVLSGIRAAASSINTLASGTQSLCDALAACAQACGSRRWHYNRLQRCSQSLRKHRKLVEQSLEIVLHVNREGKRYV